MCVLLNDLWQRQVCENCFNHGTRGTSDKWQKSVNSMPHSLVYIGFDKHPSQMTQHSFKRVKNELYCHVWFKTKRAETAKHCDVENGQNRWYLHTPMEPYGLGCHYLLKHLWLKSCWYIAVTHFQWLWRSHQHSSVSSPQLPETCWRAVFPQGIKHTLHTSHGHLYQWLHLPIRWWNCCLTPAPALARKGPCRWHQWTCNSTGGFCCHWFTDCTS